MKLRKLTKKNTKVFEGVLKDCLKQCLDEGYLPAYPEEIIKAVDAGVLLRGRWYDSGVIYYNSGRIKFGGKNDFEKLLKEDNGRLWCLRRLVNYSLACGNYNLSNNGGRLAGVKK